MTPGGTATHFFTAIRIIIIIYKSFWYEQFSNFYFSMRLTTFPLVNVDVKVDEHKKPKIWRNDKDIFNQSIFFIWAQVVPYFGDS
jgi:hypothetical protein